jgi:hypothetical protein
MLRKSKDYAVNDHRRDIVLQIKQHAYCVMPNIALRQRGPFAKSARR